MRPRCRRRERMAIKAIRLRRLAACSRDSRCNTPIGNARSATMPTTNSISSAPPAKESPCCCTSRMDGLAPSPVRGAAIRNRCVESSHLGDFVDAFPAGSGQHAAEGSERPDPLATAAAFDVPARLAARFLPRTAQTIFLYRLCALSTDASGRFPARGLHVSFPLEVDLLGPEWDIAPASHTRSHRIAPL